jgi:hypothetical protein
MCQRPSVADAIARTQSLNWLVFVAGNELRALVTGTGGR